MSGKKESDRKFFVDEHYISEDGGSARKCKYCGKIFKGKPPIRRLIFHLAKLEGLDVRPCLRVHYVVEREAVQFCEALEASAPNQRKRKHTSISTNHVSGMIDPSSRLQHVTESEGHERMEVLSLGLTEGRENLLQEGNKRVASEQRGQPVGSRSSAMLAVDECTTSKSSPIVQNSLFQKYIDRIWFLLTLDNVQCVGVYGLGGVGKSTLVREIYNSILKNPVKFQHAYWINVLPNSNACELQDKIAQKLQTNLPKEDGVFETREALMEALMEKGRSVIILDNMWKDFPTEDVGIPLDKKYCKLIITSRSLNVCRSMGCRKEDIDKVKPLEMEDAQKLFEKTLIREIPFKFKAISKAIVEASYRLPSQISKLARNLRGKDDICEWRNELNKLKSLRNSDDKEIYDSLILSYNNLNDSALKECFLRCSLLFPRNHKIGREYLINLLIVDGVIERMESRQAEFDEGHTILNELKNICFLNAWKNDFSDIWVNRLVRDMALQKLGKDSWVVIDSDEKMVNLQKKVDWEMEKLSLFKIGKMTETLMELSPNCPNLRTLILCECQNWSSIDKSFFKQMHGLTFLYLADVGIIKLPDSISDLVNLVALILHYCENLEYVPSLAKLGLLETLEVVGCESLKEMPEGMKNLVNLRCLMFPKLGLLQSPKVNRLFMKAKEVKDLKKLEHLNCMFTEDEFIDIRGPNLKKEKPILPWSDYDIKVCGVLYEYEEDASYPEGTRKALEFNSCKSQDLQILRDVEYLKIRKCDGLRSLHNIRSIRDATELSLLSDRRTFSHLKELHVEGCNSIRNLFPQGLLINLQQLEVIDVSVCKLLEELIATEDEGCTMSSDESSGGAPSVNFNATLPNLSSLWLSNLPDLNSICSGNLVCGALKSLGVNYCPKLKRMPISFSGLDDGQLSPHLPPLSFVDIDDELWKSLEWEDPLVEAVCLSHR